MSAVRFMQSSKDPMPVEAEVVVHPQQGAVAATLPLIKISIYRGQQGRRLYSVSLEDGANEEEIDRLIVLALQAEYRLATRDEEAEENVPEPKSKR